MENGILLLLDEKVSAREQTEDASEMELIIPIEDEDTKINDNDEVVQGKPRLRKEDGSYVEFEWDLKDLPYRFQKMRQCMRTDACSAAMLWALHSAAIYDFGSWVSIENFAYSICRTSANCIIYHSCDWRNTPHEAIECFKKMLETFPFFCRLFVSLY